MISIGLAFGASRHQRISMDGSSTNCYSCPTVILLSHSFCLKSQLFDVLNGFVIQYWLIIRFLYESIYKLSNPRILCTCRNHRLIKSLTPPRATTTAPRSPPISIASTHRPPTKLKIQKSIAKAWPVLPISKKAKEQLALGVKKYRFTGKEC